MTTLKRGDYCCPATEAEWKSILDLAEALGIGLESIDKSQWGRCSFVWYSDTATSEGICELNSRSGYVFYRRISVPDFIAGMYAMKEDKGRLVRVNPDNQKAVADFYMSLPDIMLFGRPANEANHLKDAIKEAIEPLRQELLSANERITKLESVINDNAAKWLASTTGTGVNAPPQVGATNGDYAIFFDPKASPKNIPFSVALEYAKHGRRIRRAGWVNADYIEIPAKGNGTHFAHSRDYRLHHIDSYEMIHGYDWEVIPETKKP